MNRHLEIMQVSPSINLEGPLVCLITDTVFHFWSKHHVITAHVVEHDIFQSWFQGIFVNKIKENFFVGGDLDSHVTLDVINETSCFDPMVQFPFLLKSVFISYSLEKENFTGTSSNQSLPIDQEHLPKIHFCHSIQLVVPHIIRIDRQWLALSIEREDFFRNITVETFVRKILTIGI